MRVRAVFTPGHSAGSTCFVADVDGYRALFTGDTVFAGGLVSLINAPGSDPAAYRADLSGHLLFCLTGGQRNVDLANERLRLSVIPNMAVAWLPPPPVRTA